MAPADAEAPTTPPGLVSAVWRGPYTADMGPGRPHVKPGDSYDVMPEQAASDHWEADESEIVAAQAYLDKLGEVAQIEESVASASVETQTPSSSAAASSESAVAENDSPSTSAAAVSGTSSKGAGS